VEQEKTLGQLGQVRHQLASADFMLAAAVEQHFMLAAHRGRVVRAAAVLDHKDQQVVTELQIPDQAVAVTVVQQHQQVVAVQEL
jgi:hypothetical protein